MKKYALTVAIFFALVFVFTIKSDSDTEAGRVLVVKKDVYLIRDGQVIKAAPQMRLLSKDTVETGKRSRTKLLFRDDSILSLGELSRVEVEEYLYSAEKKRSKAIYRLSRGLLKVVVGKSDLEIHTPSSIASARGTEFIIWIEGSGPSMSTGIMVLEGEVAVENINEEIEGMVVVKEGQMSRISSHEPPADVTPTEPEMFRRLNGSTIIIGGSFEGDDNSPDTGVGPSYELKTEKSKEAEKELEDEDMQYTAAEMEGGEGMEVDIEEMEEMGSAEDMGAVEIEMDIPSAEDLIDDNTMDDDDDDDDDNNNNNSGMMGKKKM